MNTGMALSVYTEMHCLLPKSLFGQEYNYYNYMYIHTNLSISECWLRKFITS